MCGRMGLRTTLSMKNEPTVAVASMSSTTRMVNSPAEGSGLIRMVSVAHEVVNVRSLDVLVLRTVPAPSVPSTTIAKAPFTSPSRFP